MKSQVFTFTQTVSRSVPAEEQLRQFQSKFSREYYSCD
ncbi:hypothetical protein HV346_15520 [Enterobacter sp. RHBSTW-00994]|nr:hypothetical protein [Lelliottia sp. RWM.1]QLR45569.1 hypothetical protein HV346_15520 [Enterobacter sp. RHBSTW-00994]